MLSHLYSLYVLVIQGHFCVVVTILLKLFISIVESLECLKLTIGEGFAPRRGIN
jgi:hypothetical protein